MSVCIRRETRQPPANPRKAQPHANGDRKWHAISVGIPSELISGSAGRLEASFLHSITATAHANASTISSLAAFQVPFRAAGSERRSSEPWSLTHRNVYEDEFNVVVLLPHSREIGQELNVPHLRPFRITMTKNSWLLEFDWKGLTRVGVDTAALGAWIERFSRFLL